MPRIRDAVGDVLGGALGWLTARRGGRNGGPFVAPEEKASMTSRVIAWETLGRPVWSPRDYRAFAQEGFMQNPIVYRSVRMIAEAGASIPLLLYAGNAEIESHPLLDLLSHPSREQTGTEFLESLYGYLLVSGNAYAEAVAVGGDIREVHALRPDRMTVIPGADGWPEGYDYTAGGRAVRLGGEALDGVRRILHVRLFHPADDHYGMSPMEAAAVAIDTHKAILGPDTKVSYAADWSEYFGHQPADGSGDVTFHLDPLWASPSIDAVAIDLYWPLADWRDGRQHLDYLAGVRTIHDPDYLRANVQGGEGYDWYYASDEARVAQQRTAITDGSGKPWVYRYKDIRSWWLNSHHDRPGGVEALTPTAWVPQSKPFWFMEVGCPAVDKGANQPNVFVDPKSSESALPHFSKGRRDDLMQRRYIKALIDAFDPSHPAYGDDCNPVSEIYGGRMVDLDRVHVYAWDARPYPAFPHNLEVWGDGGNWRLGHWLNGRSASAPLAGLTARLLEDFGFDDFDASALSGNVPGYVIDRPMSARDAIEPLSLGYFFDALESDARIVFRHRSAQTPVASLDERDLVETRPGDALAVLIRGQETELPAAAKINYIAASGDYRQAVAEARRLIGASGRLSQAELPIVLDADQADVIAETWLFEAWAGRNRASFRLAPSRLAIEPGDTVALSVRGSTQLLRVTEVGDHGARAIEARGTDPDVYEGIGASDRPAGALPALPSGQPMVDFIDLPLLRGDEPVHAGYVAAQQSPWPGVLAVYSAPGQEGFTLKGFVSVAATTGTTLDTVPAGVEGRLDRAARFRVRLDAGRIQSVERIQLLAGRNVAALRHGSGDWGPGDWEVVQFERAELVADSTYELSGLLRAQAGTESALRESLAAGARFVLLDAAVAQLPLTAGEIRLPCFWRVGLASRDIGHGSYVALEHTFRGLGLRPLSPVHLRGARAANGDVEVSWIRRTRVGGDGWEAPEVPLGEESERYEVDILDAGGQPVRTLVSDRQHAVYGIAEQIADFGAPQASLGVRVYQMSASYGRGAGRTAVV